MPSKIIWTTKELEEEMEKPRIGDFLPLAHVTALPQSAKRIKEVSKVAGKVMHLIVYLPLGVRDLVWVSILLNSSSLCRAVGGDNQYHSLLVSADIERGDNIEVLVRNHDTGFSHTIGVRVEVEERN